MGPLLISTLRDKSSIFQETSITLLINIIVTNNDQIMWSFDTCHAELLKLLLKCSSMSRRQFTRRDDITQSTR